MKNSRGPKEIAVTIRQELKKKFPACKFSVTVKHHNSITVALMAAPFQVFRNENDIHSRAHGGYVQLNHYYLKKDQIESRHYETGETLIRCNGGVLLTEKAWDTLSDVIEIGLAEHWDKSDSMTDYFHCAYYFNLHIGKYETPLVDVKDAEPAPVVVDAEPDVVEIEQSPESAVQTPAVIDDPSGIEDVTPEPEPIPTPDPIVIIHTRRGDIRAKNAFAGTSMEPERREESSITGYIAGMNEIASEFQKWATPENVDEINAALETYRAGYAQRFNAYLSAHSRIYSQFITGAGGWTGSMVRSMEKKNQSCDNRRNEWLQWNDKVLSALRNRFNPRHIDNAPIMTSDEDAIEKLQEKITKAEAWQARMKEINAALRKQPDDAAKRLWISQNCTDYEVEQIYSNVRVWGMVGFADYEMKNNGANIRRMKERVADIERLRATPVSVTEVVTSEEGGEKIRFVDNTVENRYQLFFPGKPSAEIREKLKSNGYRWAPSNGCWQSYRNWRAKTAADEVLKEAV